MRIGMLKHRFSNVMVNQTWFAKIDFGLAPVKYQVIPLRKEKLVNFRLTSRLVALSRLMRIACTYK